MHLQVNTFRQINLLHINIEKKKLSSDDVLVLEFMVIYLPSFVHVISTQQVVSFSVNSNSSSPLDLIFLQRTLLNHKQRKIISHLKIFTRKQKNKEKEVSCKDAEFHHRWYKTDDHC